ncbi:MAG: hypothetical protein K0S53_1660 [Bacteroidetes bacterium]|jgi:hypothetical protein|nr:hypothetical protein [Bacteroidota bacterium]
MFCFRVMSVINYVEPYLEWRGDVNERCELQFFRESSRCAPLKRLELAFVLDFLFLFHQGKRKERNAFGYFCKSVTSSYHTRAEKN